MSPGGPPGASTGWILFGALAAGVLGLCFLGGRIGPVGDLGLDLSAAGTVPAGGFMILFAASWAVGLGALLTVPRGLSFQLEATIVLLLCAASRLLLLPHPASDDVNRYLWEGRLLASGLSPYSHPPLSISDPAADALRTAADPFWAGINHPEMTAIYPPMMLGLFAVVASLSYTTVAIKAVMIAFDLGAVALLLLLLRQRRLPPRWALLYGVSPVALYAIAGQGHLDAVHLCCLLAALVLYRQRRWGWMFLLLGLAVQAKYVAVLGWPLFLRRDNLRASPIALVVAGAPMAIALWHDGGGVFESFLAFGHSMSFNGSVHGVLRSAFGQIEAASAMCQSIFVGLWIWGCLRFHPCRGCSDDRDPSRGLFFLMGAFLLLSPTVHFWYLTWVIPFVALRPRASWTILGLSVGATFVTEGIFRTTGEWAYPAWAQLLVWAPPVALMLLRDLPVWLSRERLRPSGGGPRRAVTVSVVIPALDEEERVASAVRAAVDEPCVEEVIVVDGGSKDRTVAEATAAGARVVRHHAPFDAGGGRGGQLAAGVRVARGDVVAVVHADTRLEPGGLEGALETLRQNPEMSGGALGAVFEGRGAALRSVEMANDLRAAFLGISFGDQVQLFRRRHLIASALLPHIPLMEDVELSLSLRRLGPTFFAWQSCRVSARRWRRGAGRRAFLVVALTAEYLLRRLFGPVDTVGMYRRYYGG